MTDARRQVESALRGSFLLPLLGPDERDRFVAAARPRSWRAEATIFVMDDPGGSMTLVRSGTVRIGYPTPEGRSFADGRIMLTDPSTFAEATGL